MEEQLKKEEKNKKQKLKISNKKILLFAILLVISIYLIYTIYLLVKQPTKIFTLEEGILSSEETNIGYVIRNEQVIQGQNYKNGMERIKAEGEKAAVNEPVNPRGIISCFLFSADSSTATCRPKVEDPGRRSTATSNTVPSRTRTSLAWANSPF